jgi:hypothetical protein
MVNHIEPSPSVRLPWSVYISVHGQNDDDMAQVTTTKGFMGQTSV